MNGALDTLPRLSAADMPAVTRDQMREVDRLMIEEFAIQLLQMGAAPQAGRGNRVTVRG